MGRAGTDHLHDLFSGPHHRHPFAGQSPRDVPVAGVGGALIAGILIVAIITLSLRKVLSRGGRVDGPSFTSIFQGATRWNTFIALSVAGSLFGQRGVALIAVAIAAMVPLLNLLAFYVFIRFAGQPRQSPYEILRSFASNPFIWSCAIGLILNFLVAAAAAAAGTLRGIDGPRGARGGSPRRRCGPRHPPPCQARPART